MQNTQIQNERRAFRQAGTVAAVTGSGAATDGVVAFANEPTALGSYAIATYCTVSTVAASAAPGTTYKFTRRGLWAVRCWFPMTVAGTGAVQLTISLDNTAAELDAATPPTALSATTLGFDFSDGVADELSTLTPTAIIPITDALAGSPTLGIMRLTANTGAGAAPAAADLTIASCTVFVEYIGDLSG